MDDGRGSKGRSKGLGPVVAIGAVIAAVVVIGVLTSGFGLMTPEQAPSVPAADRVQQ
jgi:hypothetical protein